LDQNLRNEVEKVRPAVAARHHGESSVKTPIA